MKKIFSLFMVVIVCFSMSTPIFASDTTANLVDQEDTTITPRFSWIYSETAPAYVTYESTATITTGNTKLSQALDSITVSLLATAIFSVVPVSALAKTVGASILAAIPLAYEGSTTLYYRTYTYLGEDGLQSFNKKCSVYYYYDEDMTDFAHHTTYYGMKA